jgi:preprotein translocase SecE subunit
MASVKEEAEKDRKPMAANIVASKAEEPDDDDKPSSPLPAKRAAAAGQPFFTIYKKGQGKWTRLGTIFVAAFLGLWTTYALYSQLIPYVPASDASIPGSVEHARHVSLMFLGISVAFLLGFALFVFWVTNKPNNADFLIATDSEMKKVNWTTKGELIGSTRVVVLFLFFVAIFLFIIDFVFGAFFHWIKVLI